MKEAYGYLLEMEDRRIPLNPYLEVEVIDTIYRANGHNQRKQSSPRGMSQGQNQGQGQGQGRAIQSMGSAQDDEDDEIVDEEIEELGYQLL